MILRPALLALPLALPLALLLASCGGDMVPPGRATPVRTTKVPARTTVPRPAPVQRPSAQVQMAPGLEGVIGADALQLGRVFGTPRLDVIEDDARKLQWSGTACILDVYLYPQAGGARPTATYVEARRGDGREVDRAACVTALRKAP
ncbi:MULTISPECIES: hypothetical protein [unclassified Novosphingobium]|uniref:hypothetical protein n=1 Tax=unclassified Novosphingobium TaxID=2644732 RepID=UPI0025EB0FCF|nr:MULTISPECIES: hypothetical protein [unclassified Novosphingobium]HQS69003.1 hypothetical protein [Novosphingobium sp.]